MRVWPGAFRPMTGDAFTQPYTGRMSAQWVDFMERVEAWLPAEAEQVYALVDNLSTHRTTDVLLFSLAHPRWEFILQPTYAAYLNLTEPWCKILRSLALKGRRFEIWDAICQAVKLATAYWNKHKHPFHWGRRGAIDPVERPVSRRHQVFKHLSDEPLSRPAICERPVTEHLGHQVCEDFGDGLTVDASLMRSAG